MINCYFVRRMQNVCVRVCFLPSSAHPHIQWERGKAKSAALVFCRRRILATCQPPLSFFLNMYLTIISDLSLAKTKNSLLSAALNPLKYESDPLFILFTVCGVEWRKKSKRKPLLDGALSFYGASLSSEQLGAAHKKGYFIRTFLKSPGTFI